MKGNPKHINSRADYLYIKEHCDEKFWKPIWEAMLESRYFWNKTDLFDKEEHCVTDKKHRYEVVPPIKEGDPVRYQQYELQENPNSPMVRFGFTEEDIKAALASSSDQ